MIQVASASKIESRDVEHDAGRTRILDLLGPPAAEHPTDAARRDEGPQAYYIQHVDGDGTVNVHFHEVDQFQVFVAGDGTVGPSTVEPIFLHYADAYTPYGPIRPGDVGYRFVTIRDAADSTGARWMPESRPARKVTNGRQLRADHPLGLRGLPGDGEVASTSLFGPFEDGLCASVIEAGPSAEFRGIQRPRGAGAYYLIVRGEVTVADEVLIPPSLVHVPFGDDEPMFVAGTDGAICVILGFPESNRLHNQRPRKESDGPQ